jgi:hypothetical protein
MDRKITIGLFGTCGNSAWRNRFIAEYDKREIEYFNPQKENWSPLDAENEADHLANDEIILFPVTNETYAFGSLGEVGFSIMQAIKLNTHRDIVVMIDPSVKIDHSGMSIAEYMVVETQTKDSIKMRALITAHLKRVKYPNVYIVDSLDNMLKLSLHLHALQVLKEGLKKYTI